MISRRGFLFLVWGTAFLAATTPGWAQKASNWRVYKSADGLPESYTSSVTVSSRGTVWAKHLNGPLISSLDGYEIKTFPSPGIGANRFYEGPSGQLWTVATNGLQSFADGRWLQYPVPEIAAEFRKTNFSLFRPVPLCPVRQNRVLFVTPDALREFNIESAEHPQSSVMLAVKLTHLQKFTGMAPARDGGLWLTAARGVAKVAGPLRNLKPTPAWQEFVLSDAQPFQNLRDPVDDDAGGVTALADSLDGGGSVLVHYDGAGWSVLAANLKNVAHAWRGADGACWATTSASLYEMKPGQTEMTANDEISAQRIYDVAVEPAGIFWLATSDGLYRYAPLTWQSPSVTGELNSPVQAIAEDKSGRLWVASDDAAHRLANREWKTLSYPEGSGDSPAPRGLFAMSNGVVVLALGDRLLQFNPASERFEPVVHPGNPRLKPLGLLKDGRLVIQIPGSRPDAPRYALECYDGSRFDAFPFDTPDLDLGNELTFLFAAQNGKLWLCGSKGLAWYHDRKWQPAGLHGEILPESAQCLAEVNEGRLWCGIQDKIWEFDGKNWRLIQAGFDRISALLKSRDMGVWVSSANGLRRYYQRNWSGNNTEEGLPASSIRALCEGSDGRLWAGTARGLSLYHPEADPDPPRTYIHDLPESKSNLPEHAVVTVSFGGTDRWKFTPPDRLLFSYHLDQKDWSLYQEEKSVYLSGLPSGKHYFQVRSMDRNWNVDPNPVGLDFVIMLPWYKESRLLWIGSAGLALALFFAAVAVNRHLQLVRSYAAVEAKVALRTKQLERANQELFHSQKMTALGTLAAGIAHDFNNILSIIKGSAQIIEDNLGDPKKITIRTGRIKTVVEQGAGIVNAMLGFSRDSDQQLAPEDINSVVEETIKLLGDRFRRDVEVQFVPAPDLPGVRVSREFVQQILLNLVFNAAEAMAENRRVILSTSRVGSVPTGLALAPASAASYVTIAVKDFGSGIAPEIMPRIFEPFFTTKAFSARRGTGLGLSMVYELSKKNQSGLGVESTVGEGSVFTLFIPVRDLPVDAPPETK